ncbi:MAG: endopeptidase La [Chloroflexota bacterium]|nr:endopeptidase La [Dehalococcoidia bacterium]MDW8253186.1 endopeptidase La [Chloroflexota bacterium]
MSSDPRGWGEYPVLPLKNVVVFPRTIVNLTIGRPKSLAALDDAITRCGGRFVVTAQRNAEIEDPEADDLFKVGTLVDLVKVNRLPDGTAQIVVEGVRRVSLYRIVTSSSAIQARCHDLQEQGDPSAASLMRHVAEEFERYAKLTRSIASDVVEQVQRAESAGRMADLLIVHLPVDLATRQTILELLHHKQRLEAAAVALATQIELAQLDHEIRNRVRQQMDRNQREYYLKEQLKAIHEELGSDLASEVAEFARRLEEKGLPELVLQRMQRELHRLERMTSSSPEANVIRTYLDFVLALPWRERTDDRIDVDEARRILDEDHYGLEAVKERIVEFLAVRQLLQRSGGAMRGAILCFAGPPGVGKTSLGRSIARSMNRKFVRISLGGVRDEAEIRGHRRTYVGALPGRILQAMRTAGVVNPVLLLDEVDKMTSDFRGDPAAALLEVLDPEQNNQFTDHYLEVPYDLSQVMFITTANVLANIPRPLRDRMEVIEIHGYTEDEKVQIGRRFLTPKQVRLHGLTPRQVVIPEKTVAAIVRGYTREAGVRELERSIAAICRKVATRVVKQPETRVRITTTNLADYLGPPKYLRARHLAESQVGVATGLAYTEVGGEVLPVEVATMPGKGELTITGRLGEVMQESARAALSYARSRADLLRIDRAFQEKLDLHIHIPEGATPKDGPSAGITMATALISALTGRAVRNDVAMTGEITLRGRVLPIGGLKEKALAAHRAGIRRILIPADNQRDLHEIPKRVRDELEIVLVETMDDVLRHALVDPPPLTPPVVVAPPELSPPPSLDLPLDPAVSV